MRYPITKFDLGLYLSGTIGQMPPGTLRRAKGVSPLSISSVKSRDGSVLLSTVSGVISLTYFNDHWFSIATNDVYIDAVIVGNNMFSSTARGTLLPMPPTAGLTDWLFVLGDGNIFKIDTFDTSIVNDNYEWVDSGSDNWYLTDKEGNDPKLNPPYFVMENNAAGAGTPMVEGTAGSLTAGQWDWGDADTLGYNTVYVHLTGATHDPDTLADNYLTIGYLYDWGVTPPHTGPALTGGGAAGNPDGIYKYLITYRNSRTGTRSNSCPLDTNVVLLMHMDGSDEGTTFTDSSYLTHGNATVTTGSGTYTETTGEVFGTAFMYGDSGGDCGCYFTDHWLLNVGPSEPFTIDWWQHFDDVTTADTQAAFCKYYNDDNFFSVEFVLGATDYVKIIYRANGYTEFYQYVAVTLAADTWYHFALIRGWKGNTSLMAFTQGAASVTNTEVASWTYPGMIFVAGTIADPAEWVIGARQKEGNNGFIGGIDEFRFARNTIISTSTFVPPSEAGAGINTITVSTEDVDLSGIPASDDTQVDEIEIWRTVASGAVYFYLTSIPNGQTQFTDNLADASLTSTELPTDNIEPYEWFDDAIYHNASCFWLTRTQAGNRGRVYYSPVGRNEAVQGYINVTGDDDPLQKFVYWAGMLIVFSESGAFQILGTNPYTTRRISGLPGVKSGSQYTAITTPIGVIWEATDGVRIFTGGTQSYLLAYDAIKPIFRGLAAGNLSAFTGVTATYARGEYHIADGAQHIAYHLEDKKWRDCSLATDALYYAPEVDILGAANATILYDFENEGEADDGGTDIAFEIEVPYPNTSNEVDLLCQRVVVDANTNSEVIECALVVDGTEYDLGDVTHATRLQAEFPAGKTGSEFSVRLSGSLDAANQAVEVFEVAFDIYNPRKGE